MILEFTTFIGYEYSQSAFHFRKNLNYNVVFNQKRILMYPRVFTESVGAIMLNVHNRSKIAVYFFSTCLYLLLMLSHTILYVHTQK